MTQRSTSGWTGAVFAAAIAVAAICFTHIARADDTVAAGPGPVIGAAAPHDLALPDQSGAVTPLADRAGEAGVVVMFVRAASWCPYCQKQLIEMSREVDALAARGYRVVAVSTDTVKAHETFAGKHDIGFPLLADPDSVAINAWDVRDPAYAEGHRAHGVPFPITVVVNAEGNVAAKFFNAPGYGADDGYVARVEASDVLAALDELGADAEA